MVPKDCRDWTRCWGEMTGVPLPTADVYAARQEDANRCRQMDAYDVVEASERKAETGEEPISCRWKDINKVDATTAEVRGEIGDENFCAEEDRRREPRAERARLRQPRAE